MYQSFPGNPSLAVAELRGELLGEAIDETGREPGTGFAYPRAVERTFGRVPTLAAGASQSFTLDYTILSDRESVTKVAQDIAAIQTGRETQTATKPETVPVKQ